MFNNSAMWQFLIPASLSPLEHTEHTIPEEYIVVFKKDAKEVHSEHVQAKHTAVQLCGHFTIQLKSTWPHSMIC